jgi:hypothetical protein
MPFTATLFPFSIHLILFLPLRSHTLPSSFYLKVFFFFKKILLLCWGYIVAFTFVNISYLNSPLPSFSCLYSWQSRYTLKLLILCLIKISWNFPLWTSRDKMFITLTILSFSSFKTPELYLTLHLNKYAIPWPCLKVCWPQGKHSLIISLPHIELFLVSFSPPYTKGQFSSLFRCL